VGCGYVLSRLVQAGKGRGTGLDDDWGGLRLARQVATNLGVSLTLVRGDARRMPFPDGRFDLVFSQGLVEHFPPETTEVLIHEHVRVLRPGGILAVSVPNLLNPFHTWRKWREGDSYRFAPERSYTPGGTARMLARHGIRVRGRDGYGIFWSLWNRGTRVSYYLSAILLRLGLGHAFEARLPPAVRSVSGMMTLVWGERSPG
jgi:SAM-dependent methyltransferase